MKKLISILAVIAILFTVTACSNNKTDNASGDQATLPSEEEQIKAALTNYFTGLYTGDKDTFMKYRSSYTDLSEDAEAMSDEELDQMLKDSAEGVKDEYGDNIKVEIPDSDYAELGIQIDDIDNFLADSDTTELWYTDTIKALKEKGITRVAIVDGYINIGGDKEPLKEDSELMMVNEFSAIVVLEDSGWKVIFI